jgi:hypothetical protein
MKWTLNDSASISKWDYEGLRLGITLLLFEVKKVA